MRYTELEIRTERDAEGAYSSIEHLLGNLRNAYSKKRAMEMMLRSQTELTERRTHVALVLDEQVVVGFSLFERMSLSGFKCLYFLLAAVDASRQKRGVYSFLIRQRFAKHHPDFIIGRPHNPLIYYSLSKLSKRVFPNAWGLLGEGESREYAALLSNMVRSKSSYDCEHSVIRSVFDASSRFDVPTCEDEAVNSFFRDHVGHRDAVLMLVDLREQQLVAGAIAAESPQAVHLTAEDLQLKARPGGFAEGHAQRTEKEMDSVTSVATLA